MTMNDSRKWAILFAVVTTQFAVPFMISGVGVCLPAIGREFGASAISLSLVESVFMCGNAMFLLPLGRAGDICGRGGVFLLGLVIFALSAAGLTLAPNMNVFLAIRGIQAFGGAMTLATGLALLYDAFPFEERGKALGISMAGIYLGISAGPFLGGVIVSALGWRWLFYAGMIPCLAALAVCMRNLHWKLSPKPGERFDWLGTTSSALGIGLLVFGSAHTESDLGWWCIGGGLAAFAAFVFVELKSPAPLVDLNLFRSNRPFSLGLSSTFILSCSAFAGPFLLSLYLQYARGMSPAQAGTTLVVQPLVQCLVSPVIGRMADRIPAHILAGAGSLFSALGICCAAFLGLASPMWLVIAVLAVSGFGIGVFSAPSMVVVMSSVDESRYGVASALTGQARTTGMTACMTVVTTVLSHFLGVRALGPETMVEYVAAMQALFAGFAVLGLAGTVLAFMAKQRPVEALATVEGS
jgi:MFS family permease